MTGLGILSSTMHLENSDDCAKQPAQLEVLTPAAGSRRPTWRRPLGSRSRGSLLWAAHELAAQRHGRLRLEVVDIAPLVSTDAPLHLTRLSRGAKAKEGSPGRVSILVITGSRKLPPFPAGVRGWC